MATAGLSGPVRAPGVRTRVVSPTSRSALTPRHSFVAGRSRARSSRLSTLPAADTGISSTRCTLPQPLVGHHLRVDRRHQRRTVGVDRRRAAPRTPPAARRPPGPACRPRPRRTTPGSGDQQLLQLARVHVVALVEQHVLLAVDDRQVAVLVEHADVAGAQPAVDERVGGRRPGGCGSRSSPAGRGRTPRPARRRAAASRSRRAGSTMRISVSNTGTPDRADLAHRGARGPGRSWRPSSTSVSP